MPWPFNDPCLCPLCMQLMLDDWGTWRTSSILTRVYPKVCWEHIFEDCIQLYTEKSHVILNEFPFRIRYKGEMAVDTGGVSWDMFSAFGKMPTWQHLMEAIFLYLLHILAQYVQTACTWGHNVTWISHLQRSSHSVGTSCHCCCPA